jgi:hypothetical protein
VVKVHYGEGVATHTGPESCTLRREASREALTGVCVGQVVSGESNVVRGPMPSWQQKATGADAIARGSVPPRAVWDPGMHIRLLHGNRESSVTALRGRSRGRNGKTGGHSRR